MGWAALGETRRRQSPDFSPTEWAGPKHPGDVVFGEVLSISAAVRVKLLNSLKWEPISSMVTRHGNACCGSAQCSPVTEDINGVRRGPPAVRLFPTFAFRASEVRLTTVRIVRDNDSLRRYELEPPLSCRRP